MTDKITKRSKINFKFCSVVFFSLFIFTQCARDDTSSRKVTVPSAQKRVLQQQYQPTQYYRTPNSQAYSNPYDFVSPYGQSPRFDNDETYELPKEYHNHAR